MPDLHLPMRPVCDSICNTASDAEYAVRIRRLLWPGEETGDDDVVKVDELAVRPRPPTRCASTTFPWTSPTWSTRCWRLW